MIFIVPIEPIDQRYTKQWYYNIPKDLEKRGLKYRIVGDDNSDSGTTTGAFLNFAFTNKYKAQQVQQIADLFSMGHVAPGDKFLVTDAWNFAITAIRYMSDLCAVPAGDGDSGAGEGRDGGCECGLNFCGGRVKGQGRGGVSSAVV